MRLLWGLSGEIVHLHATVNPESRRILLFSLYPSCSIMSVYAFMKVFIKRYRRLKLVWVDGGSWYNRTLKRLRLKPQVICGGFRNRLERCFPTLKCRIENSTGISRATACKKLKHACKTSLYLSHTAVTLEFIERLRRRSPIGGP